MDLNELKKRFFDKISKDPPNEWEIEEYLGYLLVLPLDQQNAVLDQVPAIWPVSHALCYNYISQAKNWLACLEPDQLQEWVVGLLDTYELAGLHGAQHYMADVEKNFLCKIKGASGIELEKVKRRLQVYAQGLTGEPVQISPAECPSTDGETMYLPAVVDVFAANEQNYLLYKFMTAYQAGHTALKTYRLSILPDDPFIQRLSQSYDKD